METHCLTSKKIFFWLLFESIGILNMNIGMQYLLWHFTFICLCVRFKCNFNMTIVQLFIEIYTINILNIYIGNFLFPQTKLYRWCDLNNNFFSLSLYSHPSNVSWNLCVYLGFRCREICIDSTASSIFMWICKMLFFSQQSAYGQIQWIQIRKIMIRRRG